MAFDRLGRAIVYVMDAVCTVTPDGAAFVTPGCAAPQPLSSGEGFAWLPAWSRDGERLTFIAFQDRQNQVFVVERDGGSPRRLSSITVGDFEAAWLP
jgi:Tol biopolymer transport system component